MAQRTSKNTKIELEEFIVPGELTEIIEEVLKEPRLLQRTIRAAGMPLSASALAGCSLYYIEKQSLSYGPNWFPHFERSHRFCQKETRLRRNKHSTASIYGLLFSRRTRDRKSRQFTYFFTRTF